MDYYSKIPESIMYDDRLSANEKLVLTSMKNLPSTRNEGVCYMKNSYFTKLLNCTVRTVQRILKSLESKSYISIEVKRDAEIGTERKIYIVMNQEVYPATLENEITETEEEETTLPEVPEVKPGDQEERKNCHGGVTKLSCNKIITRTSSPTEKLYIYRKSNVKTIPKAPTLHEVIEEYEQQGYKGFSPVEFYKYYVNANGEWIEPKNKTTFIWKEVLKTWNNNAEKWKSQSIDAPKQTRPGYNSDYPREEKPKETAEEREERNARLRAWLLSIGEDQEKTAPVEAENKHEEPQNEVFCDEAEPETQDQSLNNEGKSDVLTCLEPENEFISVEDTDYKLPEIPSPEEFADGMMKVGVFRANIRKLYELYVSENGTWRPEIKYFDMESACKYFSKNENQVLSEFLQPKMKRVFVGA